MFTAFSTSSFQRAPLNTDVELVGFPSLMGLGMAYFLIMTVVNIAVIYALSQISARKQMSWSEAGLCCIIAEAVGSICSGIFSPRIGIFSILPIIAATVIILIGIGGFDVRRATGIACLYYGWHLASLVLMSCVIRSQ